MENLQGNKPAKTVSTKNLSGPLTWILLMVFVISIFGIVNLVASDSPASSLRRFFDLCFEGKYEDAWDMVQPNSDYAKQYDGDVSKFKEMWTRTKSRGTSYLKIRIDGVEFSAKSTSDKQTVVVAYSIMTRDQVKDEKTNVIQNQINDSNYGYMTMEKLKGQNWKLVKPR